MNQYNQTSYSGAINNPQNQGSSNFAQPQFANAYASVPVQIQAYTPASASVPAQTYVPGRAPAQGVAQPTQPTQPPAPVATTSTSVAAPTVSAPVATPGVQVAPQAAPSAVSPVVVPAAPAPVVVSAPVAAPVSTPAQGYSAFLPYPATAAPTQVAGGYVAYPQYYPFPFYQAPAIPKLSSRSNKNRRKKLYKRSIVWNVIFCLLFTPYMLFWIFEADKETKAVTQEEPKMPTWLLTLLSGIMLGLYLIFSPYSDFRLIFAAVPMVGLGVLLSYWAYNHGKFQSNYFARCGQGFKNNLSAVYVTCFAVAAGAAVLLLLFPMFIPGTLAKSLVILLLGLLAMVPAIVALGMMQSNLNKMIDLAAMYGRQDIYVKDSCWLNGHFGGTFILFVVGFFSASIGTSLGKEIILNFAYDFIEFGADPLEKAYLFQYVFMNIMAIVVTLLVLLWFTRFFRHNHYKGVLVGKNFGQAMLLCAPTVAFCLFNLLSILITGAGFNFGLVVYALVPGITEEIAFRGMVVPNLLRLYNDKRGIYIALFVSAGVFGLAHFTNFFGGQQDLLTTLNQVFYAFALGMVFAAVLIRTGNMWASIICHTVIDLLAFMIQTSSVRSYVPSIGFNILELVFQIVICAGLIAYSIYLVRGSKHAEILSLWREKFGSAMVKC